jgi:two-component system, response regulator RegA
MRTLLVEDDLQLREAIREAAANWVIRVPEDGVLREMTLGELRMEETVQGALRALESRFDLLIVDVKLGSESGLDIVRHARKLPWMPAVLAMSGTATASEAFELAALGARGYLAKPFDLHELRAAIEAIVMAPPDLEPRAEAQVGFRPIHAVQDEVRLAMLKRALLIEDNNLTRAARRLGVTRTAVQQMLDRFGLPRPSV